MPNDDLETAGPRSEFGYGRADGRGRSLLRILTLGIAGRRRRLDPPSVRVPNPIQHLRQDAVPGKSEPGSSRPPLSPLPDGEGSQPKPLLHRTPAQPPLEQALSFEELIRRMRMTESSRAEDDTDETEP